MTETSKCLQTGPPDLSEQQLLAALDTEIKFVADSQRNEGWTRWAIWGATAALVWIATDLWGQPSLALPQMVAVALLVFVIWKFFQEIISALLPSARIDIGPVRFRRSADIAHPLRPAIAVAILQYLLIIAALAFFKIAGQRFLWAYALTAFGISAVMLCSSAMIAGVPTRVSIRTTINVLTLIQLLWLAAAGWQLGTLIYADYRTYSLADVRFAFVLNAGAFLISRLVVAASSEHLLGKLTELRQHIAFGRMRLDDANIKTEELLTGITLAELLKPLVRAIYEEEAKLQQLLADANRVLDKAKAEMVEQRPQEALRLLDSMGSPPTAVVQQLKRNKRAWGRFAGQAFVFALYSKESRPEIKAVTDEVKKYLEDVNTKLKACFDRYNSLKTEAYRSASVTEPLN